ncbi:hypothetical protein [Nakamurella lactea]|uniref:hypothetical protein n=1 Tax=Nakamurella lactea TaxID=459515 RepID=UPI00041CDE54|nr:hypothetical protein [Nakamurella lactea]
MDKFLKIAGIVLVAWIAFGLVGWVFGFLATAVFWVAVVAGGIWLVGAITGRGKNQVGGPRAHARIR